jgi:hypothetical protein
MSELKWWQRAVFYQMIPALLPTGTVTGSVISKASM